LSRPRNDRDSSEDNESDSWSAKPPCV
jgi:hypothetical protein